MNGVLWKFSTSLQKKEIMRKKQIVGRGAGGFEGRMGIVLISRLQKKEEDRLENLVDISKT